MQHEHFLHYNKELTSEKIKTYIKNNSSENEVTCLVPKDNQPVESVLQENGFRYCGKRLVQGQVMIVFKWFRDLDTKYEDMHSFFNRRVHDYDLHMRDGHDNYDADFISLTEDLPYTNDAITVLDLGCGTGVELKYIFQKSPYAHVVCIDVAKEMLTTLCDKFKDYQNNIETVCSSYLGLDFGKERYDYVVACNTLHHLLSEDKLNLYINIKKGLKKKGFLLISDYIALNSEEEQSLRTNYLELIEKGVITNNHIYHIDLPLTKEHEIELLITAGFLCKKTVKTYEKGVVISAYKPAPVN